MRLPFQLITSPKTTTTTSTPQSSISPEQSKNSPKTPKTPKTPKANGSRKRKPSSEGENARLSKIGRLTTKENVAEPSVIAVVDLEDNEEEVVNPNTSITKKTEKTTPSSTTESVVHIKIPSRRKQDLKSFSKPTFIEEQDPDDDSVVYLNEEDLVSLSSKKTKKITKKKKSAAKISPEVTDKVEKALDLDENICEKKAEVTEPVEELIENNKADESESKEVENEEPMQIDEPHVISDQISKLMNASGTTSISPVKDILEILSDDEKSPSENDKSLNTSLNSTLNKSIDVGINKSTSKVLTPKAQARRDEFERRRVEKELQKKKEREEREALRLKEKEQREEAKRKEKEEKEQQRLKEKEEREVS